MDERKTDTTVISIVDIIDRVVLREIFDLIYPAGKKSPDVFEQTSPYIKFLPIISCIEFLGACYDELPFEQTRSKEKTDIAETRFNKAIKELFPNNYLQYSKADSNFYMYKKLRCSMIHQLKPTGGISFTTRKESWEDGNSHLNVNSRGLLIFVLEDFYDDLQKAAEKIIRLFRTGKLTNKKGDKAFIEITSY